MKPLPPETQAIIVKSIAAVMIIAIISLCAFYSIVKINMRDDELDVLRAQVEYFDHPIHDTVYIETPEMVDTFFITVHDTIRPKLLIFFNNDSTQAMVSQ
jgi:hypothetical protein